MWPISMCRRNVDYPDMKAILKEIRLLFRTIEHLVLKKNIQFAADDFVPKQRFVTRSTTAFRGLLCLVDFDCGLNINY